MVMFSELVEHVAHGDGVGRGIIACGRQNHLAGGSREERDASPQRERLDAQKFKKDKTVVLCRRA